MATLQEMLTTDGVSIQEIGAHLDALDHEARMAELYALNKKQQRELYVRAASAAPITLEHFVPADVPPLTEVIHEGKNSLPVFREFQKRFCRPAEGEGELFGYNEGSTRKLIGPGFYVAHATAGTPEWEERGAVVVNYFRVPEAPVVEGWPKVKRNNQGLQMFVYNKTRDFMRKVSEHASIGIAFRKEKSMDSYFILTRRPH